MATGGTPLFLVYFICVFHGVSRRITFTCILPGRCVLAAYPPPPLIPKGGGGGAHSPAAKVLGESQFRRLKKKLSTLPTLWCNLYRNEDVFSIDIHLKLVPSFHFDLKPLRVLCCRKKLKVLPPSKQFFHTVKGSLTRDFRLQFFFLNQCPPGPWVLLGSFRFFCENSRR